MKITTDKIKIKGTALGRSNPLPMFKSQERTAPCSYDDSFKEEDKKLFGYETGFRVLPYKMQDNYSRNRDELELNEIILENECLKARFLADFGGRLISLYDKVQQRELLFNNSVFQPANLSTRDAWFSSGIEWNVGQFGHSVLTCEALFFARMTDDEGNQFLRLYEYERNRKVYFSIDFHLPSGAKELGAYVRIVNKRPETIPMYWWTNIAVPENNGVRVLSETDQVIYIKPESNITEGSVHKFGRGSILNLPSLEEKDPTYPLNFTFSSEYFFQNPKECESPWEAAIYDDGFTFFERSTAILLYRKMFCWGNHSGGRNWCDYLSSPGKGDYLEIQAGMAPTQIHGLQMPGNTAWDFTQIFGSTNINDAVKLTNWIEARDLSRSHIDSLLSEDEVKRRHNYYQKFSDAAPNDIIHFGSGWGALESLRDTASTPKGFHFPIESINDQQEQWLSLLKEGKMPISDSAKNDPSWMVDPVWQPILENCIVNSPDSPWPLIHLGVLLYENDDKEKAVEYWQKSISIKALPIAWRNMAMALKDWGENEQATDAMKRAVALEGPNPDVYIIKELMVLLQDQKKFNEMWKYFSSLPKELAEDERVISLAARAALEKGNDEFVEQFFQRTFAYIKEGETKLVDLWFDYQFKKASKDIQQPLNDKQKEEIQKNNPPPKNINFTMTEREYK